MSPLRSWKVFLAVAALLVLALVLVGTAYQFYAQVMFYAPLLGNLVLGLFLVGLGIAVAGTIYYLAVPRDRRSQRPQVAPPKNKQEAASETLKAIQQQVMAIQDEVARQALLARTREIEASLARGNFTLVVFGTGSAGKTSLVNALIGRQVGAVAATVGTTQVGETYHWRLPDWERDIAIVDAPGVLEPGVVGTQREQLARQLATEADLLLFVVDNDLRQSEWEMLRCLGEIGKRSLLVFNKIDLYPESDRLVILHRLRERLAGTTIEVVATAADPQIVTLETGERLRPKPQIAPLVRLLAAILRAEGEDLMADNILLRSQQVGTEARQLVDRQRRRKAEAIVERFMWIVAGVVACTPLPGVDLLATAAVNAQMVVELGNAYGCSLNLERGKELALSVGKTLLSLGMVKGASELVTTGLQLNPATFVVARGIQGATAAYLTRIAGLSFIEYFRRDGDWGDGGVAQVVQEQFQLHRKEEFVREFIQDTATHVFDPIRQQEIETEQESARS